MTIEQFVPLTATRCVRPATRNRSISTGSSPLVSPSTRPGSSPRSSSGSTPAASRSPARTTPAARCHHGGVPTKIGGLSANRVAPCHAASSEGASSRTPAPADPGARRAIATAGASTTTWPSSGTLVDVSSRRSTSAGTATRGAPATPCAAKVRGSPVVTSSSVTDGVAEGELGQRRGRAQPIPGRRTGRARAPRRTRRPRSVAASRPGSARPHTRQSRRRPRPPRSPPGSDPRTRRGSARPRAAPIARRTSADTALIR